MLEDDFNDCLKKAMLGLGISAGQLAKNLGCSVAELNVCLNGAENEPLILAAAPSLGLDGERLINLKDYQPRVRQPADLTTVVSPFGHLGVNAFIIETEGSSIIFDTGTDSRELVAKAQNPQQLLITHEHPDHSAGVTQFRHIEVHTPASLAAGSTLGLGEIEIECLDVSGHYTPALAYLIHGLKCPVAIVGDCLFAGSIGRIPGLHYRDGLMRIRENILTLPEETILCPGHGPLTTVGQELENNPFF